MIGHSHHRNAEYFTSGVVIGNVNIGTTEVELKVGSTILDGRRIISIVNDSSYVIYISTSPTFTIGWQDNYTVYSGSIVQIDLNPNPSDGEEPARIYAKLEEGSTTIKIVEGR